MLEDLKTAQTKVTLLTNENRELTEYVSKKKVQLATTENQQIDQLNKEKLDLTRNLGAELEKYKLQNKKLRKSVKILNRKLLESVTSKMLSIAKLTSSNCQVEPNVTHYNISDMGRVQEIHQPQEKRVHFDEASLSQTHTYSHAPTMPPHHELYGNSEPIILPPEVINKEKYDARSMVSDISRAPITGMSYHNNYPNLQKLEGDSRPSASDGFMRTSHQQQQVVSPFSTQQDGFGTQRTTSTFGGLRKT